MTRLIFAINIKAPKEVVWDILWNDSTYRMWSSVFTVGSYCVTNWEEGSKILFLSLSGSGMYSYIVKKIPFELMSFKHLGVVKNGEEQPEDEITAKWSGSMENYCLKEANGITKLRVELDVTKDYISFIKENFPVALKSIKHLSEKLLKLKSEYQLV